MWKRPYNNERGALIGGDAFSDSETAAPANYLSISKGRNTALAGDVWRRDLQRDEDPSLYTVDEFGDTRLTSRIVRNSRQRKKWAARSKGGEFQERKSKGEARRVYFCCVSSEIDVQKLYDYLIGSARGSADGWKYQLHSDVLHLFKSGTVDGYESVPSSSSSNLRATYVPAAEAHSRHSGVKSLDVGTSGSGSGSNSTSGNSSGQVGDIAPSNSTAPQSKDVKKYDTWIDSLKISGVGAQEVFIFDFGAAVFWGFSKGEETNLLKTIRMFVTKGFVGAKEFQSGEDDIGFASSLETDVITISNDVITLPEDCPVKQRLSVSFAAAQSSVLAVFEARVDCKVDAYRYIPETLAACGKVHLSERQLGIMIGEVFVIRHDVNLHTEILDTPDFFWKEERYEEDYKLVMRYLEMSARTEVLNKRLDMLRELLDVLQQQMENAHAAKLEWIVIWLIVVEVVLQVIAIGGESLGWWKRRVR